MRRHRQAGGHAAGRAHAAAAANTDTLSPIRTFNSETNPSRPIRPSPLTASQIHGMPLDLLDRLRSFPLFLTAPDDFLAAIGSHLRPQQHSAHDYILTEGDEAKAMYWLVRGAVAVTSRDGEATYAELKPGAFFGEIGILMDIPRTATIVARTRCLLVVLKKEDLRKELPKFPEVERAIREEAQERLTILNRKKKESGRLPHDQPAKSGPLPEKGRHSGTSAAVDMTMGDTGIVTPPGVVNSRKRKSPSPGSPDQLPSSSALGSGLVNVRQLLKELPLFATLPPDILHFLGLNAQARNYPPFTNIIKQDTMGREIYFIVRGEVEVVDERPSSHAEKKKNSEGAAAAAVNGGFSPQQQRAQVKARLRPGQYFGEVTSLSLAPRRTATVRSVSSVECLMISGDVLNELWKKCSPSIRKQVEQTARKRLGSVGDEDVAMIDAPVSNPQFKDLEIADSNAVSAVIKGGKDVPKVTVDYANNDGAPVPNSMEDQGLIEPSDPDPFLNLDLDNLRQRSRRGSLAPPAPDQNNANGAETTQNGASHGAHGTTSPRQLTPSPSSKPKHGSTPPEHYAAPKRPKTLSKRPTQFGKGSLPDGILIRIFQNLDIYQLMRLRRVSGHWSKLLSTSREVLQELDLREYNRKLTDQVLVDYVCPFVGNRPHTVDISNCFHLTDDGFTALANTCGGNVRTWKMKSVWDITAQAVLEMANKAKTLEEVDLSNCRKVSDNLLARVVGWVVQEPPAASAQAQAQVQAPNGTRYHHHRPTHPSGGGMAAAPAGTVIGCPQLKRLTLSYCKHVTDRSMAHLAVHAASRLEHVDLTRCTTITDQGFQHWSIYQFTNLTRLCLADCTYLTDNAIVYLTNAAKALRELDLSFCCALSDTATEVLALGCPYLTLLRLSFCGSAVSDSSLRSIGLHLLELRELSVRGCVRVTGLGVEAVVEGCHNLELFDVSQCKNLTRWLDAGGVAKMQRLWERSITFETVAPNLRRAS